MRYIFIHYFDVFCKPQCGIGRAKKNINKIVMPTNGYQTIQMILLLFIAFSRLICVLNKVLNWKYSLYTFFGHIIMYTLIYIELFYIM